MNLDDRPTRYRYVVLLLLISMYAVSYMDRVCIAAIAPGISREFGLSPTELGGVFSAFSLTYALLQIPGGRIADRFGPHKVLASMAFLWSAFTVLTAFTWNRFSLLIARLFFGAAESGSFPTASRSVYQWFPTNERGFVQGITHSGARLGGAITPPIAAWLMVHYGWRTPFVIFGVIGVVWVIFWLLFYRDNPYKHPRVNQFELDLISKRENRTPIEASNIKWTRLFHDRNLLLLSITHFCYVYTFWIFITWFPTYLIEERGFEPQLAGLLAGIPLFVGAIANTFGGWLSDRLVLSKGHRFGRSAVAVSAFILCLIFIVPASLVNHAYLAILLFVLAAGSLECITGVSWAASVDLGKDNAGLAAGVMNTAGNIGGAISPLVFGILVEYTGKWQIPFLVSSNFILIAAGLWTRIRFQNQES